MKVIARQGRCANTETCPLSRAGEIFTVPEESDFLCPVCGHKLKAIATKAKIKPQRIALFATAAALVVLVTGLGIYKRWIPLPGVGAADLAGSKNTILRLAGSNTIGESLMPALAESFLKDQGATDVHTVAGEKPQEKIVLGTLPGDSTPSAIRIAAHGSATAFTALADQSCDIGMASRRIKPDENSKLAADGDMFAASNEHIVGLDGIAVIVNTANPLSTLTKDEIMRIFTGAETTWPTQAAINVYARDDKSGTYDTFKTLVLGGKPLVANAKRFENSDELSDAVSRDPNGIGFIGLPFIHAAKALAVSEKGTQPLLPTRLTVATEDYSLARRLYLYTSNAPSNKLTRKFVDYVISKQGQDVVAANGFVAQNVVSVTQTATAGAPSEYRELTENAERLSLDFRFQAGVAMEDSKAQVDLDRVAALIADRKLTGDKIMLLGFADGVGSSAVNQNLSVERARLIESEFIQRGIRPATVRGFGAILPVASNDTADGREKNRRVEIWLQR